MIEVIYQGTGEELSKNENNDEGFKLPKNVRQIGDIGDNKRIYVEDFVMSYIKRFSSNDLKYGVLLGSKKYIEGNTYFFITGAVKAKPILDNEIIYDDYVWTGIYEDIKSFFSDVEIIGWFATVPGMLEDDFLHFQKIHLDNFAGNNKVFFLSERVECEDSFYLYDDGGMKKTEGYYIYYEKNDDMQAYMLMNEEKNDLPKDYEQTRKNAINAKVHKLLYKNEDSIFPKKNMPTFAYSVSSFLVIAVLLATIAIMNASGKMQELKEVVAQVTEKEEKMVTDIGNVKVSEAGTDESLATTIGGQMEEQSETETQKQSDIEAQKQSEAEAQKQSEDGVQKKSETENINQVEKDSQKQIESEVLDNTEIINNNSQETSQPETTGEATIASNIANNEPVYEKYIVKKGDSLYRISKKFYGDSSKINEIMELNNFENENYIKEGQTILLP